MPRFTLLAGGTLIASIAVAACGDDDDDSNGTPAGSGTSSHAGSGGQSAGGHVTVAGTSSHAGATATAGNPSGNPSDDSGGAAGSAGSDSGGAGAGGAPPEACGFHTPAHEALPSAGSDAGGAPALDVDQIKSRTLGSYLTDGTGRTLYVFGSDVPGDCRHAPESACTGAPCAQTWSSFSAGSRSLAAGVSDDELGDFTPAAGLDEQSTYHGWPLYRYTNEEAGQLLGQGIAGLWHAVKVPFYNVMLMKKQLSAAASVKYISDGEGFAIYRSTADAVAPDAAPSSSCDAACSRDWPPFTLDRFVLPSSFAASDFSLFLRGDGRLQVAYRGAPLYRSTLDQKPGDTLGADVSTFVLADPAL
jgi:predicted lipoprotein with Yx(FWY)xxD motif